jgi:uncharacterized repeat protein (TIGR01451 family)
MLGSSRAAAAGTVTGSRHRGLRAALSLLLLAVVMAPSAALVSASPASVVSVQNIDSPDPVESGSQLTYTITVVNTGGAKATEVELNDQVNGVAGIGTPPQLVLSSTVGTCTQTEYKVTCKAGTLQGGQVWTVTIRGIVTAAAGTTLNNVANVTGTKSAQTFNTSATATTLVTGPGPGGDSPDLSITKTGPSSAVVSSPIAYTLTVNNTGTLNATDITVVDTLPAGVTGITPVPLSSTSLFDCDVVGQTVTCTGGRVNAGSNATITIDALAPATTGTIANTASVDPEDAIAESNEFNNASATVSTTITAAPPPPGLSIAVTDAPDPTTPGSLLTYVVTVTNVSGYRADYLTLTDGTQGLEAASLSVVATSGGTTPQCVVEAPKVTCQTTRLPSGGVFQATITGFVVASAGSTLINTATIDGNIRNTGVTNTATTRTTIKPGVDLTITKADSPDPVCASSWPGGPGVCRGGLTYTFVVGNGGIEPATGVRVRDPLPAGLAFDSFTQAPLAAGFTCAVNASNVLSCTGGTIGPESTVTITVVLVAPPDVGTITNTVTVDPFNAIYEADETNNVATITTTVKTGIDLTVVKTDSPPGFDPIATSGTQTYTITVDNIGTQDATNIRVRDTLPADSRFRDVTADNGFTCSHSGGVVECVGGSIRGTMSESYDPPGPAVPAGPDDATITIRIFAQPYVGTMHNEVRVDPLGEIAEANETNNIDIENTTVGSGDGTIGAFNELSITKADSPDPVPTSSIVTYTIVVTNSGTDPAVNVAVRDFLPTGFIYIEATDSVPGANAFLCVAGPGNTVNCSGATINAGGNRTLIIKAFSSAVPGTYTNQALVDPEGAIPEGNETNNAAQATTQVNLGPPNQYIDLKVEKTDTPDPVTPGGLITYTVTVSNDGTNPAFSVVLRDVLPADTTFVSATDDSPSPGDFICSQAGGVVNCTGGTLDGSADLLGASVGTSRIITIRIRAPLQHAITITNQAFVDPDNTIPEANEINNADSEDTSVQSKVNLKIAKTGTTNASQGSTADFELKVTNEGQNPAFGVEVHDALPVGLIPLSIDTGSNNNFICQVLENPVNVIDCEGDLDGTTDQLATLTNEVTIKIRVFVTAESNTKLDNEACVDPDEEIVETNELDNCSTASLITGVPDLVLQKDDEFETVTEGQNQVYTISLTNAGDATAPGTITVTDDLPSGLTYVSSNATNSFSCSEAATVVTCTKSGGLAPAGNTVITITATVTTSAGPIVNSASVNTVTGETNTGNNTGSVSTNVGGTGNDLVLLSVQDQPDPVPHGDTVTFTTLVANAGSANLTGVKIRHAFSSTTGLTLVSATASQGFACSGTATIDCNGDLTAGASTTVTIVWLTSSSAPPSLTTIVTVDPLGTITESDETNNSDTEVTTISGAICSSCIDLVTTNIIESADPVEVGDTLNYIVTVGNVGDQSTTTAVGDLTIWFDLNPDLNGGDANFTFVSQSATNGFTCSPDLSGANYRLTTCSGDLGPGEGTIITITVTVTSTGANDRVRARVEADPLDSISEFVETNNISSQTTTVNP